MSQEVNTELRYRRLGRLLLAIGGYYLIGIAAYELWGHRLITAIYNLEGRGILQDIVKSQLASKHDLGFMLDYADRNLLSNLTLVPLTLLLTLVAVCPRRVRRHLEMSLASAQNDRMIDELSARHVGLFIALAAGTGLFVELLVIRLHSSYFQLFAYFKNVSLLSSFLGLGIGYAIGGNKRNVVHWVMGLLGVQLLFLHVASRSPIKELLQNPISEQFTMGLRQTSGALHVVVVLGFLLLVFCLNVLTLIPLGQVAAGLMTRMGNLQAYGFNLLGSIVGIFLFSILAMLWTPPLVWVLVAAALLYPLLHRDWRHGLGLLVVVAGVGVVTNQPEAMGTRHVYSPYQILALRNFADGVRTLNASHTYYQFLHNVGEDPQPGNEMLQRWIQFYSLPYRIRQRPERVLIVGAGTGNDVAAAIRNGAGRVDAVEIDPAILEFGRELHPNQPYSNTKTKAWVDDARAFMRSTDQKYDLIVYGLLDSHTLLSGQSGGIRLDSYVYTVEGLREARGRLERDGVLCLSFALISDAMGTKLYRMLRAAFDGKPPVALRPEKSGEVMFVAGEGATVVDPTPLEAGILNVTERYAGTQERADVSTDDWPFLYMPVRTYPATYLMMILLLLAVSLVYLRAWVPGQHLLAAPSCFFLGAGFMLVETKGITELALVFGSTWMVTSVVIFAILCLAFLANFLVIRFGERSGVWTYTLLLLSVACGLGFTYLDLAGWPDKAVKIVTVIVLTVPLFFSGLAFSRELRVISGVGAALGANLLGAMLGGLLEYNAMYFGFRSLYLVAIGMYVLAFLSSKRAQG